MKVYAIKLSNGHWGQGGHRKSTEKLQGAKLYGTLGKARQAVSYHGGSNLWKGAEIVSFTLVPDDASVDLK
jgi:hypothetical protein